MHSSATHARAMVFVAPGHPLESREMSIPVPGEGEAIVRVTYATLCGSDLHSFHGRRSVPTPTILGHEIIGIIERIGPNITDQCGEPLSLGDRVTWGVAASCGDCFYCGKQLPQKCEHLRKYGHELLSIGLVGGLATHCHLLPGTAIYRIPDDVPDAVACPASCATATVAGVLRAAGPLRGETMLIFGAGMLGLTAAAMAREAGVASCLVCDVDASRLDMAVRFGATDTVTPEELESRVQTVTDRRGVGIVLELSGASSAIELGMNLMRIGGTFVWAGSVFPTPPVAIAPEMVVRRMLSIRGVHNYHPDDLATALKFLATAHSRYPFAELVGRTFHLDEANEAFQYASVERPVRVAVIP